MTPAAGDNGLLAPPATRLQGPHVTPEIIALHTRQAHELRWLAMHAALRACGFRLVRLARRAAHILPRRRASPMRRITTVWK